MDAEVFPVEVQATHRKPCSRANDAATDMPVSLNDPVGFMPWCLAKSCCIPAARTQRGSSYKGVLPSLSVVAVFQSRSVGRSSRKRQTPLSSIGKGDVRRCSQIDLWVAGSSFSHPG